MSDPIHPLAAPAATGTQGPAAPRLPRAETPSAAAKEFEAMFLTMMVDNMMKTAGEATFGGGHAEETWRSFLSESVAQQIADQGRTGIAESIERHLGAYRKASL